MMDRGDITEEGNALPMVEWDRCVLMENHAAVYGWTREKGRRPDFVVLQFWFEFNDDGSTDHQHSFLTSSVTQSPKIHEILEYAGEHLECQIVHDELPDLDRKVWREGDPHVVEPAVFTGCRDGGDVGGGEWLG